MKPRCPHPGCGYGNWEPARLEAHASEPHHACACGRLLTDDSLRKHLSHARGAPHDRPGEILRRAGLSVRPHRDLVLGRLEP